VAAAGIPVGDVEQLHVHGRLLLCVVVEMHPDSAQATAATLQASLGAFTGIDVSVESLSRAADASAGARHLVTVLARPLTAAQLSTVFEAIACSGANVERIVRLSETPVTSYELTVAGTDPGLLRRSLGEAAADLGIDVAVQRSGLQRRARHLVVLDVDSTLVQGEAIDLLAAAAGKGAEVEALTAEAMAGRRDFAASLRARVAHLAGLDEGTVDDVGRQLVLAPGARTLIRTLRRLGHTTAVVSGGFTRMIQPVVDELGIDFMAANVLEIEGGQLTGRLSGPVVDRAGKAAALERFAQAAGVPLSRTVAVGDGANDIDMLVRAGLGIAFNAKPVLRDVADAAVNVPYLDSVLFLLGIPRSEIEAADAGSDLAGRGA